MAVEVRRLEGEDRNIDGEIPKLDAEDRNLNGKVLWSVGAR